MEKIIKSEFKAANLHKIIFELFCSYFMSIILLSLMMLLVYLGTLAQTDMGIYAVQEMFFDSIFFMYPVSNSFSIPLPGGYLVLTLLVLNIICGGIIRLKYSKRTVGIFIIHIGVIYLLVAGLVSFHFAQHGFVRLNEGESTDYFEAWTDWDLHVTEFTGDKVNSYRLPLSKAVISRVFKQEGIPFDIKLIQYAPNASIISSAGNGSIDGFDIKMLPVEKDEAKNVPAVKISVMDGSSILWGNSVLPYILNENGNEWQLRVVRHRGQLPFKLKLKKFNMELHPNTDTPSAFESSVEVDDKNEILIQMNEPLRREGVAVFQSSYEKHVSGNQVSYTSVFSTVVNPSDQWPLYACILLSIGLLIHFIPMLTRYTRQSKESK